MSVRPVAEIECSAVAIALDPAASRSAELDRRHPSRWQDYYELTKPRMNFLVLVTAMVGFYMASRPGLVPGGGLDWVLLLHALIGTALTAGSSGVINQFIERGYDALMPRTANRPLAAGRLSLLEAAVFGGVLGVAGIAWLYWWVNPLTALLGAITYMTYILVYTPMKRWSTLCTVVGAIPGALPPVMGFAAASNQVSLEAMVVFAILFFWQMPHFLAIAILYRDDYRAGGFQMLPCVEEGLQMTSRQIIVYSLALLTVSLLPTALRMTGAAYFAAAVVLGIAFLSFGVACATTRTRSDARKLFFASILYLPILLGMMMADRM